MTNNNKQAKQALVKAALIEEIQEAMPISTQLQENIKNAKTPTKRNMLTKKLKKHNNKVADLVIALDRLDKNDNKEADNGNIESSAIKTNKYNEPPEI